MAGTAQNLIADWAGDEGERSNLFSQKKAMVVRWLNQAQLRFADRSECLQGVWEPTLDSDGSATLPEDFLRAYKDKVGWGSDVFLREGDYALLKTLTLSATNFYTIFRGKFYVFAAAVGTASIPYVKKPVELSVSSILTDDLEVPTEYHQSLIVYLDAMNLRRKNMIVESMSLLDRFDADAAKAGGQFHKRRSPVPMMRGGMF